MVSSARLIKALEGGKVFRERRAGYSAVVDRVRAGLPYAALEAVATRYEIPTEALVRVLHIPPRTLARRKQERRLRPDESDRLLRLARIAARAEEVLGSRENAAGWLREPIIALGGVSPLDYIDTELGAREVEHTLGRIEHGVYS
jgi:putative toxin-antitoxin system antitoxin component (TIGR02293 family)